MSDITPFDFEAFDEADRQARRQRLEQLSSDALILSANVVDRTQPLVQQAEGSLARVAVVSMGGEMPTQSQDREF